MHVAPEIEFAEPILESRCPKCDAGYGFSACRQDDCPVRTACNPRAPIGATIRCDGPKVIVLGNEKGGTGKSTIAMHLIVALMRRGFRVGAIDLDGRQGTLSRYIENRQAFNINDKIALDCPECFRVKPSEIDNRIDAEQDESTRLKAVMLQLADRDYVVIDTPGNASFLSLIGHSIAQTLITPINDSFLDLDLIIRVDEQGSGIETLGLYSDLVAELRSEQLYQNREPVDWVVVRNRLSHIDARNKRDIGHLLDDASKRAKFRMASGFGERVIFRELFLKGLTLFDLRDHIPDITLSMSHIAARQEIRSLLITIGLPRDDESSAESNSRDKAQFDATLSTAGNKFRSHRSLSSLWHRIAGVTENQST